MRKPIRSKYDAFIELAGFEGRGPVAVAVCKMTFEIDGGRCKLTDAAPLLHDYRDQDLKPRLQPGTDFWIRKERTDLVVRGSAFPPNGAPAREAQVSARIGEVQKRIAVFGKRRITWNDDRGPAIEAPEPFEWMPMVLQHCYGGLDYRHPVEDFDSIEMKIALGSNHPGMYPRNPYGKGYLVMPDPLPGAELPNLEDPDDLLTAERLILGDARNWYKQPLPWCFDWMSAIMFPRSAFFMKGLEPWFPGPADETLPEIKRGYLAPHYRNEVDERPIDQGPDPRFYQESSHGMQVDEAPLGVDVVLEGMHPKEAVLAFKLPETLPTFEFVLEGKRYEGEARVHHVVFFPLIKKVEVVYAADANLPRMFIPGVHKHIPVAVSINSDELLHYEAPPTRHDMIAEAMAKKQEAAQ